MVGTRVDGTFTRLFLAAEVNLLAEAAPFS